MKTQIYTMQTADEARAVVALGVDHIGITPANLGLPGEVDLLTNPIKVSVLSHEKKFMPDKESATCFVDSNIWLYAFIEGYVEAIRNP